MAAIGFLGYLSAIAGFFLFIYLVWEGITNNIMHTEPGAVASFVYWIAGAMHQTVSVNLVMLFYVIALLIAVFMVIGGIILARED